jgi:hypothetical protein
MKTSLYRHFDADGVLLYVGVSLWAVSRLTQHRHGSRWFHKIANVRNRAVWIAGRCARG